MSNPERPQKISRREFLRASFILIALGLVAVLRQELEKFLNRKAEEGEEPHFKMAKEIVAASRFCASGGSLEQVVAAINLMNQKSKIKIPAEAFEKEGEGWFKLKPPDVKNYWPAFWNFEDPLPLGFLSLFPYNIPYNLEETIAEKSNMLYPCLYVYASLRWVEELNKRGYSLEKFLDVQKSMIKEEKEEKRVKIECPRGIFRCGSRNNVRFFPFSAIGLRQIPELMSSSLKISLPRLKGLNGMKNFGVEDF